MLTTVPVLITTRIGKEFIMSKPENRICDPSAALHKARNGVGHSVASCALQLSHSCGFQDTKLVARNDDRKCFGDFFWWGSIALLAFIFLNSIPAAEPDPVPLLKPESEVVTTTKRWSTDLDTALAGKKPVVILVGSATCHWCEVLKQDAVDDDGLRQALTQTTTVALDGPSDQAFCARFGIEAFPTLLLVNRRHEVVRILRGYLPPTDLAAAIRVLVLRGDEPNPQARRLDKPPATDELLQAPDPAAAIAAVLDATSPAERQRICGDLAKIATAQSILWTLLDHPRPTVRLDAAAALGEALGQVGDFDPLAPAAERTAQIAAWRRGAIP